MTATVTALPAHRSRRVILIERDARLRASLMQLLKKAGMEGYAFEHASLALEQIVTLVPDVVLVEFPSPTEETDDVDLLTRLRQCDPDLPVVLMTTPGTLFSQIPAVNSTTSELIEKPFDDAQLIEALVHAFEQRSRVIAQRVIQERLAFSSRIERLIIGQSPSIQALRDMIIKLAPTPASVIISGETGTGKEMVARCLHDFSGRKGHFVAINCAAIPENLIESELFGHEAGAYTGALKQRIGKIEYASGGTLFLDEIESMPLHFQAKLLRVLQERQIERLGTNKIIPVDLRVVVATKMDLKECSLGGTFRNDLFYRLNVAKATIPALRERRDDIPLLFDHFLKDAAERFGQVVATVSPDVQRQLLTFDWPGNVRELRNAAEQVQLGLPLSILHSDVVVPHSLDEILASVEKALIDDALRRHDGVANSVCRELQVNYSTLYRKMKLYALDLSTYRCSQLA